MKKELIEIYNENITNRFFLDKKSVQDCMEQTYLLGEIENEKKFITLKDAFNDLLDHYADFGKYNCSREDLINDWKQQGGLL